MKCCLNSNQSSEYLKKADELKVLYKDRNKIIDFVKLYPDKIIILDMKQYNGIIDWNDIKRYKTITNNHFIIGLNSLENLKFCKEQGVKFYWNFPINNYQDLQSLKNIGAEYALIDSPLVQDIINVSSIGIKLRLVPNIANYAIIPKEDGVCGSWIRPEDLSLYDKYISVIEFEDCDLKKEQALYRIYFEQKTWPGDLNMLITNLNYSGVNRMIPQDFTIKRMTCGQRCMSGKHCKLCYRYLNLANPDFLSPLIKDN